MQTIDDYIKQNFASKKAFAKHLNIGDTTMHYWIRQRFIVVNGRLYAPRRKLTEIKKM